MKQRKVTLLPIYKKTALVLKHDYRLPDGCLLEEIAISNLQGKKLLNLFKSTEQLGAEEKKSKLFLIQPSLKEGYNHSHHKTVIKLAPVGEH